MFHIINLYDCGGIRSLVNGEILFELGMELGSYSRPAATIDVSGIRTHNSLRANRVWV